MKKTCLFPAIFLLLGFATPFVRASEAEPQLKLVPQPREVQLRQGGFHLGPRTRILVQLGHQQEDRIAAETLAEEVADQSGLRLNIVGTRAKTKAEDGAIMLVRLQDARVRRFLAQKGLRADSVVGEDGYLLFSDKSHLIVAANTGEGLFSGVQTLRQLLRAEGKDLICPSVAIRDWPNLEKTEGTSDLSGQDAHALVMQFRGPGE
jgi:hexosaminidase